VKLKLPFTISAWSANRGSLGLRISRPPIARAGDATRNSLRGYRRWAACGALLALAPAKLFACAACYGAQIDDRMADGMNWAILSLGAIVAVVLGAFLTFLIYAIRKSEAVEAARVQAAATPAVPASSPAPGANHPLPTLKLKTA